MDKFDPFSQESLNEIFKISLVDPERIISRESSNLEFKESFGWKSIPQYLRTCAAFANTHGGHIVFGISNSPHKLVGLSGGNLHSFKGIDSEKLTQHLNDHFSPEIPWELLEYELQGKLYGLLYVYESQGKPVICTKDAEKELKEGDIYYRYRGRTERIKYPELRAILENTRMQEQRLWMRHLTRIAKIGVKEVGVFDLQTGEVAGTSGSFLIDESLLSQLSFIKEGQFSEIKGKPTLKLLGNVKVSPLLPISTGRKQIIKTKGIRIGDIVQAFLNREKVLEPLEYIKQICFESTAYLPVYYFMDLGNLDSNKAVEVVNGVVSRAPAKSRLVNRMQKRTTQKLHIPENEKVASQMKRDFAKLLLKRKVNFEITGEDLIYCLQAIRGLSSIEVRKNSTYLRALLKAWFNAHYALAEGSVADHLRRAICWVDEALYMKEAL